MGRLRQRQNNLLTLTTPEGPRSVQLTAETAFRTEDGKTLAAADLRPGDLLAVWGTHSAGRPLAATLVVRLDTPPQRPSHRP